MAKASMARLRLPGVLAAPSPTTYTYPSMVTAHSSCLYDSISSAGKASCRQVHTSIPTSFAGVKSQG